MIDVVSCVPISLIQALTNTSGANIKILKLSRLPRLYRLLRLLKLVRLYRSNKFVERLVVTFNLSMTGKQLFMSLISMLFLLHFIGCMWATVATLTAGSYESNWMIKLGVQDMTSTDKYVASVYWAA